MDALIIFSAKYLFLLSPIVTGFYFLSLSREVRRRLAIFFLLSLPLTYLVGLWMRQLYDNPRPFAVGGFEPLIEHEADNGFPSDHTLLLGALAGAMIFFHRKYSYLLWSIALVVGFSRVFAGVHHFLDIFASMVIALTCAILVKTLWKQKQTNF